MIATVTGLGATDMGGIAPGYPVRPRPVNLEDRADVCMSSTVCPNGSVAATSHSTLGEVLTRCVAEEWDEIRAGR